MKLSDLKGKRLVIWGIAREGVAVAEVADRAGITIELAVDAHDEKRYNSPNELVLESGKKLPVHKGDEALTTLLGADVVCKSPGISIHHPYVAQIKAKGIPLTSATDLWLSEYADKAIAVTGSKGKSTTSSLLAHLMKAVGFDVVAGGNIGVTLLTLEPGHQWYVAELSSHQAMSVECSPYGVLYTVLFPEHLDWYKDVDEYYNAKMNLAAYDPHFVVANGENQELRARLPKVVDDVAWVPTDDLRVDTDGSILYKGERLVNSSEIQLMGRHNRLNICLCLRALQLLGIDLNQKAGVIRQAIVGFKPLAHRLEPVSQKHQLLWVDDGLSTSPEAAIEALKVFPSGNVTVLFGGSDKGLDYTDLKDYLAGRQEAVTVLTIPDSGEAIADLLAGLPNHKVVRCSSLEEAVHKAAELTPKGGAVLLSPGAASFGRFANYEERSEAFKRYIDALDG